MDDYSSANPYLAEHLYVTMADSSGYVPEYCCDAVYPCRDLTVTGLRLFCSQFCLQNSYAHQAEWVATAAFGCRCLDLDWMSDVLAFVPRFDSN